MRLFLLPISTRRTLIYCEPLTQNAARGKVSWMDWGVNKANTTWAEWEKDTKAPFNVKRRITEYGNLVFRRIPFEEWGLKSIPARKITAPQEGVPTEKQAPIEVRFPGLYQQLCTEDVQTTLRRIATERQPLHQKRMRWCMIGMPITLPIGLLPVIPNIPFFYLAFRAWSHWKALGGSKHLEHLIQTNAIKLRPDPTMDSLYTAGLLHPSRDHSRAGPAPSQQQSLGIVERLKKQANGDQQEVRLLNSWNGKLIAERLNLPAVEIEIERAVEQVEKSMESTKKEELEKQQQQTTAAKVQESAEEQKQK